MPLMKFCVLASFVFGAVLFLASAAFADHSININTADKDALVTLTGIGEVKAQAIIDYRATYGPYASIEDIQNVSGIGPATYDSIKDHITVQGGNSAAPSPSPSPTPSATPPQTSPSPPSQTSVSASGFSVEAGGDRVAVVGADMEFIAHAYRDKKIEKNVKFTWNFGDGSTRRGPSVSHRFEYAGRYVVVVTGVSLEDTALDRFVVTAEDAELLVHVSSDGSVEIENIGGRDIDLSRWIVRFGSSQFMLPDNSLVLAGEGVRIGSATLGFHPESSTELAYPDGSLAFRAGDTENSSPPMPASAISPPVASAGVQTSASKQAHIEQDPVQSDISEDEVGSEENETTATSSQIAAAARASSSTLWWIAALAIALVGAGSLYLARRFGKGEWNIIEDKRS